MDEKSYFLDSFFFSRSWLASWISPNRSKIIWNFYEKSILILFNVKKRCLVVFWDRDWATWNTDKRFRLEHKLFVPFSIFSVVFKKWKNRNSCILCMVNMSQEIMFSDIAEQWQGNLDSDFYSKVNSVDYFSEWRFSAGTNGVTLRMSCWFSCRYKIV